MASGIFAILDDVALLLDDTAAISKIAAKKTMGLLGDDLAVNAEKATGFHASRELPVIWAITKGSMINKLIILPLAFLLSAYLPWLIVPILLVGGAYLSYEGAEKVYEWVVPHKVIPVAAQENIEPSDLLHQEKSKIKAAVRTDFILSIEIIIITLGTVVDQRLEIQILVVSFIALLATVGVYGLVALLVRMDDAGLRLIQQGYQKLGSVLVSSLPYVIRLLGVIGTIAMLLVGGGLFVHNIESIHHLLVSFPTVLADLFAGLVVGFIIFLMMKLLPLKASH
ncbi:MAG: DUF808 domain-containing protein [Gammaproteobacteria bacterium]|nr:DUF808 domain-containing protein [Gammaproteobacteria bacterium]